ncbi:MAG: hypothetical protein K2J16_05205 [Clostridia bacterium]|nr:hypothetical protein [Clostridia bacterium]
MKKRIKVVLALLCAVVCGLPLIACNAGKSTALGKPQPVVDISYNERTDSDFVAFKRNVEQFAATFAAHAYDEYESDNNFAVSPISVYMALSLAAECASDDTRAELLSALGVSYDALQTHFSTLYRSLAIERKQGDTVTSVLNLTNSIWVNKGTPVKQTCIDTLSNNYYAYSYSADFAKDNANANKAVRKFVKDQTKGLIDKDFKLDKDTLFTLINTLYLKTIWNIDGKDLPFAQNEYTFTAKDGTKTQNKLLQGYYNGGRVFETDTYSTFYTSTHNWYKIKFILPKDGYNVDDVFTADNIAAVNAITDYNSYDKENNVYYETRCIFPEYKCSYDGDIMSVLKNKFGINKLFINPEYTSDGCNLSTLTDTPSFCTAIQHVTNLTVNKKGIEGAAVTVMIGPTSARPAEIKLDFVIDKAFGFIITDSDNVTLFSGVVNKI